jgi:hypothetical protein
MDGTCSKNGSMERGQPVRGFPIEFEWHTGDLLELFDRQVALLQEEVARARAENRLIVYLSCPISGRGGGYHVTNIDIAKHNQRQLMNKWGERFWILNPAMYQMESKEGRGLLRRHAEALGIESRLESLPRPTGGDYMRMWTKVLIEDEQGKNDGAHLARNFDAFYFLGPSDVRDFFTQGGSRTASAGIEEYFARKFVADPDFRDRYSVPGLQRQPNWETRSDSPIGAAGKQRQLRDQWENQRTAFFRFYALRASANFSLGCHDEWNLFRLVNQERLKLKSEKTKQIGDVGALLAGFFDGRQIAPCAARCRISPGYEYVEHAEIEEVRHADQRTL